MKKHFLFSALAVMMAVGGAVASNKLANTYFEAGDQCEGDPTSIAPCTPGSATLCKTPGNIQYYYSPDGGVSCLQLRRVN